MWVDNPGYFPPDTDSAVEPPGGWAQGWRIWQVRRKGCTPGFHVTVPLMSAVPGYASAPLLSGTFPGISLVPRELGPT